MGVLRNIPFTIPIKVSGGAPLTAMTVTTAPSNVTGFALQNINLTVGSADMVGTYTAAPSGATVTASINAKNSSGNTNGSFALEAYTCSWASSVGSTAVFDGNQSQYVTGSQSAFGAAIANGMSETTGTGTVTPTCSDLDVPALGASTETLSNPFSGTITPTNNDNSSAESDMWAGCGTVSIVGTKTGSGCGARTIPANTGTHSTTPPGWQNGGTLSLSIGSQSDDGDTNTGLAFCPPSQAAVNAGLGVCTDTVSTGSSSYSWNFSGLDFLYNGQPVPQASTATLNQSAVQAGDTVTVTGGSNWWGNAGGAPVAGTGHTQAGSYYSIPSPGVYIGTSRATAVAATSSTVQVSATTYACGQASSSVPPNPCTFTPGALSGSFVVPASLAPGTYNVYIDETNTSPFMGNGPNDSYQTTRGTSLGTAESSTPLVIGVSPSITSANSTSFPVNASGSFTVTTTGSPNAALSETGTLPSGVTFTDNGNGTATLAGTPAPGSAGAYPITIHATNGVDSPASQAFTLDVDQAPSITSADATTFTESAAGTFSVTTSAFPVAAVGESGSLPAGVNFVDNGNGTASLSGTPASGSAGSYPVTITADNGDGTPASQAFTLTVNSAPSIISAGSTTFTAGTADSFTVTSGGSPTPALTETGSLPSGVTFVDNGDGTAALAGTPATGSGGVYPITISAANGAPGSPANQSFTLTVDEAPSITSAAATTFDVGDAGSFSVTTDGYPTDALTETGSLPSGVTFSDNGDGTATLAGTPAVGTGGTYPVTITADNGDGTPDHQSFTLTVDEAVSITSASSASDSEGSSFSFMVTTIGSPTPALSETGGLPSGVTFTDNNNGTATLAGTPAAGSHGTYPITITADNGNGFPATQSFTLTINEGAAITSADSTSFEIGSADSFTVTTTGSPAPALSETGSLPSGVTFVDNGGGTATLAGTPADGTGGTYPITITADNGVGAPTDQSFALDVEQVPTITSADVTTFTSGTAGTFTVTTTGSPAPALSETGSLPSGVTFVDNGGGTATLAGTPADGTGGTYPITITADNGDGGPVTQDFTLTVDEAPAITSGAGATVAEGGALAVTVTTSGYPAPALSETGSLPSGVTFVDTGDGTATLSGTPAAGTSGTYPVTIGADNGVGSPASQSFTLTVVSPAVVTSAGATTFTSGSPGTFTVTTTGSPAPTLSATGSLPSGVTFVDNGGGTATLAGTPAEGTGGTYPITITATNGVGTPASQSFTLTVDEAPAITSATSAEASEGSPLSFTVTATGTPVPALTETGSLPSGVTLTDHGDGTATLGGTPTSGSNGTYPITISADNGVGSPATQHFTLTVSAGPIITSANHTTFTVGMAGTFTVTTVGLPAPALTETGTLPSGITFTDNGNGTATVAGTPASGTVGAHVITITATNGVGTPASQSFTLSVNGTGGLFSGKVTCAVSGKASFSPKLKATSASSVTFSFKVKKCVGQSGTNLKQGSITLKKATASFVLPPVPPATSYNCPSVESDLATPPALAFNLVWAGKPATGAIASSAVAFGRGTLATSGSGGVSLNYSGGSVVGSFANGGIGTASMTLGVASTTVAKFLSQCGGKHGATSLTVNSGSITLGS